MPAITHKYLLLIMSISQILLLLLFWRQNLSLRNEKTFRRKASKRSNCDCSGEELKNGKDLQQRFETKNGNSHVNDDRLYWESKSRFSRQSEIYKRSNITVDRQPETNFPTSSKNQVVILVAIITARQYEDRRQGVRETWMQDCDPDQGAVCKFFTDSQDGRGDPVDQKVLDQLKQESARNRGDLILLNTPSGLNFSLRLLALFEWAKKNINFDYLLRIDDDQFLCLDRLTKELPFRPRTRLYWGYLHCTAGMVRIDEGMMILSSDLIDEFLRDKDGLMCHKYGDQAVAMWIYNSMKKKPITWFGDPRVHHDPPASYLYEFRNRREICHTFLSLHGTYPAEMRAFQKVIDRERRNVGNDYAIPPISDFCPYRRDHFDWSMLTGQYRARPVPCKDEPIWLSLTTYQGRTSNHLKPIVSPPKQIVRIHHVIQQFNKFNDTSLNTSKEAKINPHSTFEKSNAASFNASKEVKSTLTRH